MPQLIRIDGERMHAKLFAKQFQQPRVEPCCLALTKRVVQVKSDLHHAVGPHDFYVAEGHAVFEIHPRTIFAMRKAPAARYAAEIEIHAPAQIGMENASLVGIFETVK